MWHIFKVRAGATLHAQTDQICYVSWLHSCPIQFVMQTVNLLLEFVTSARIQPMYWATIFIV